MVVSKVIDFCKFQVGTLVVTVTSIGGRMSEELWFDPRQGQDIYVSFKASKPALGPTQPLIILKPENIFQGEKQPGHKANLSLHLVLGLRINGAAPLHTPSWRTQGQPYLYYIRTESQFFNFNVSRIIFIYNRNVQCLNKAYCNLWSRNMGSNWKWTAETAHIWTENFEENLRPS
jgi:hypothetical protein